MQNCPKCATELPNEASLCPKCGLSLAEESAQTAIKSADDNPTELKETKAQGDIHTTTSDGSRFVAGHVLAGRYRIIGLTGKGGMGEVYKAEDLELEQTVALKFLPQELAGNENLLKRFRGEVRTARQVSHENVCRVFDIGETEGRYYITMEFIEGDDLSQLLTRIGRLPSDKAVEISREICLGLNAIHKADILHRDLKPANIIVDAKGRARITDFGIAGIEAEVQGAEARVGTPAYMSPEQITGKEVTKKSDIYSLGLLLYEIFTGKQAYEGKSVDELIRKHQSTHPTSPSKLVTGIDPLVEKLIDDCLKKNPRERPGSALTVAMSLPGGNPLEVALEAGETPTPEMVASAPGKGELKSPVALMLLIAFVSVFLLVMYFTAHYTDAGWSPIYKSRDVLVEQARTMLDELGYKSAGKDSVSSFGTNQDYDFYVTTSKTINTLEKYRTGQPAAVEFWYRQSPDYIVPLDSATVTENDPPKTIRGSEFIRLDMRGRLMELVASPAKLAPQDERAGEVDWRPLFKFAGLDIEKFRESASQWTPPVYADGRTAWVGTLAEHNDIPIRIEAASFRGRPVLFRIIPPWDEERPVSATVAAFGAAQLYPAMGIVLIIAVGGLFFSYKNIRAGRVDREGAIKVTAFIFICTFIIGLLSANHVPSVDPESRLILGTLSNSLLTSAVMLMLYLAVEPLVRRWWPELLISWNRLLSGDFRNPIIGRDMLVGGLLGFISIVAFFVAGLIRDYIYTKELTRQTSNGIFTLNGTNSLMEFYLSAITLPIISAFGILILLLVFYMIFRKRLIGTAVLAFLWALFMTLPYFFNRGVEAGLIEFVVIAAVVFFYARFGLVAIITSHAAVFITSMPITFDPARPYFAQSMLTMVLVIALAVYAFYISLGKQKLFEGRALDGITG